MNQKNEKTLLPDVVEKNLSAWKEKYGKVYRVVVNGKLYIYRALTRKEWREIQSDNSVGMNMQQSQEVQEKMENDIVKTCLLYPGEINFDEGGAGTPGTLSDCISEISGFRIDEMPEEL